MGTGHVGRRLKIGIAKEATRGAGAAPTYLLPSVSWDFKPSVVKAESAAGLGLLEDAEESFVTTQFGEGSMEGEIRCKSFGLFLMALLVDDSETGYSVAGPTDESYTHSYTLDNDNQHMSLALVVEHPDYKELHKLVMLNELEIRSELDEIVMFTASFLGQKAFLTGLSQATLVDEPKFTKKHLSFKIAATVGALDEASEIRLKSLRFRVAKNLVLDDVLGTAWPIDILNRQISVEGEITLNWADQTGVVDAESFRDYMMLDTDWAVQIQFTNTDETLGGGTTNPSLKFELPKVMFFDWAHDASLDEVMAQTVSFKGYYDSVNSLSVISTCELVNAVTTY